jgi:hypothetical protein
MVFLESPDGPEMCHCHADFGDTIAAMTAAAPVKPTALNRLAAPAMALALAACAVQQDVHRAPPPATEAPWQEARILDASPPLQCVAYARMVTRFDIRGDAWRWWNAAEGRYRRGRTPKPGALLVFRRYRKSAGHLAVVSRAIDDRTVIASHANWLNSGRIHENTPIRDVSAAGDWSSVRVWYVPGAVWGASAYPTYGFIYAEPDTLARR